MSSEPPAVERAPAPDALLGGEDPRQLVGRVLEGDDPALSLLAARGLLPLAPRRLIPLQVQLATGGDAELADAATESLRTLDPRVGVPYLLRHAGAVVLGWFATHGTAAELLEAVIRRRDVPRHLLVELAPRLSPALQESLVLRQDAIVDEPAILDALAENPSLTTYARRRIGEYRQHLLPRRPRVEPLEPLPEIFTDEPTDVEVAQAVAEARRKPAEGEQDESTGLSEAQIRFLPIPVRLKLTRGAPRGLRTILIRDPNPLIARSVLRNNRFSEQEIEQIAQNRNIDDEVLGAIAKDREWVSKYRIVVALVRNPRTPLAPAVRLVSRLSVRDLRILTRDRNVPEPVRSTARRLYRIKRI